MNKNVMTGVYTRENEEHTFAFYTSLSAYNKIRFVNNVVGTLVDDNYNAIIKDLIFDFEIIEVFTDVNVSDINKIDLIEEFISETNIVDIVKANVDNNLIEELNKSVDLAIEYRTGIHRNPIAESLSNLLDTIEKKISGIDTNEMMRLAQAINGVTEGLTPEKIIDAYAKSDLFKEKYKEIIENKEKYNDKTEHIDATVKSTRGRKKSVSTK